MNHRYDGLKILVWTLVVFFFLAGVGLALDNHFGWSNPDLEEHYWFEDGRVYLRKGGV